MFAKPTFIPSRKTKFLNNFGSKKSIYGVHNWNILTPELAYLVSKIAPLMEFRLNYSIISMYMIHIYSSVIRDKYY